MIQLFPIILVILNTITCKDTIVNPTGKVYTPGPRNYTWKIYSLNDNAPFNHYTKIWGSDPTNIWIVGNAGDFDKTILRFNGQNIYPYGALSIDPTAVYGFSNNDVWFAGSNFDMWKFNGNKLYLHSNVEVPGFYFSNTVDIWGDKPNNVFAVGSVNESQTGNVKELILHFDGSQWELFRSPNLRVQFFNIRKGTNSKQYYMVGFSDSTNFYDFYQLNEKKIDLITVGDTNTNYAKGITLLDDIVYLVNGKDIFKGGVNSITFYKSLKNTNVKGVKIWGRNEKDFFIQTQTGLGHYDGSNLLTLFNIDQDFGIFDGIVFSNEVFFVGYYPENFKFFLIHGVIN